MEYVFEVTGMTCGHCERAVLQALHGVDAAAQVDIDRAACRVTVSETTASRQTLAQAMRDEGYTVAE